MKKIITLSVLGFIICTAYNNKPRVLLTDYRDSYTGSYFCSRSCQQMKKSPNDLNTSSTDTLTLSVTKDALDSILSITIRKTSYQVKLKNNILYSYPAGSHWGGKFFSTDSISFISTGLGNSCGYRGKKK